MKTRTSQPKTAHGLYGLRRRQYYQAPITETVDELSKELQDARKKELKRFYWILGQVLTGPVRWEPGTEQFFYTSLSLKCPNPGCQREIDEIQLCRTAPNGRRRFRTFALCKACKKIWPIRGWAELKLLAPV